MIVYVHIARASFLMCASSVGGTTLSANVRDEEGATFQEAMVAEVERKRTPGRL